MSPSKRTGSLLRIGLVATAVLAHQRITKGATGLFACHCADPRDPAQTLVVMSWNLENFPGDHDRSKLASRITEVAPHVLAVQEVLDADALAALLPDHATYLSAHGGSRGQTLGLAVDPTTTEVTPLVEYATLELGGRVRPAVSAYVRTGSVDFHLVVVHLKARPAGLDLRRLQWAALADVVARLGLTGAGADDDDVIVIGDFNATGAGDLAPADERAALGAVLGAVGLRPLEPADGCSAYWDGTRRDAWLEPALLDLAFVGGFDGATTTVRAIGACAKHRCAPLRSTEAHPDRDIVGTSDHCPLVLELSMPRP